MEPPIPLDDHVAAARALARLMARRLDPPGARWRLRLVRRSPGMGGSLLYAATDLDADPGRQVAVKIYGDARLARAERDGALAAQATRAPVARPVLFDPGLGLLVSEWVAGPTLIEALAAGRWRDGLAQAGRWLRAFHRPVGPAGRRRDGPLAARAPAGMDAEEAAAFRRAAAALDAGPRGLLARLGEAAPSRPVRLHGDFHYRNLILSATGPVGIDLATVGAGGRHRDLAQMTAHLLLLGEERGPDGLPAGTFDAPAARAAFLAGYGRLGPISRARLARAEALDLLGRWQGAHAPRAPKPERARAARAILARQGWLAGLLALMAEAEVPARRRPADDPAAVVAAA